MRKNNSGVMYVYAVVIVGLFVMAFLWFVVWASFTPLRTGVTDIMTQYNNESSPYPNFLLADTFMYNLWAFFMAIVVFGLLYWAWLYSQRKNMEAGYR